MSLWMKFFGVTIQMKTNGAVPSFGTAYSAVEIQWCDYSNESYSAVLFFGTVRMFTLEASRSSSSF